MSKTVYIVFLKQPDGSKEVAAVFSNWAAAENYITDAVWKRPELAANYMKEEWRVHNKEVW